MALRKSKIASEIVLNNYRYLSSKSDLAAPFSSIKVADIAEADPRDLDAYRYVVAKARRSNGLPKIEFPKEPEELIPLEMRHLQPAMLPKFMEMREEKRQVEWEPMETDKYEGSTESSVIFEVEPELECPFPEPIKELRTQTLVLSDQKKAEMKSPSISVNLKTANFNIVNRNYSTSPFSIVSRSFARASATSGNMKDEKCEKQPKPCKKPGDCPSFTIKDCPPGNPKSECIHPYIDPKCTKKLAPYPSYSESCAERLPDDPSECMQCPWKKCGGADAIKPPKRHFHTCSNHDRRRVFVTSEAAQSMKYMPPFKECDAKKEPCKQPPGKCEKHKEEEKKKKCPEQPKKKKCDSAITAYRLWDAKENILPTESWRPVEGSSLVDTLDLKDIEKLLSYKDWADLGRVSERNCQTKKVARRHRSNVIRLEHNCPKNRGGHDKGPYKKKCPVVDTSIDPKYKRKDPCCEEAKRIKKHRSPKPKVYVPDQPNY